MEYVEMKIITVCGSYKFKKQMIEEAEKMTLKGNCMITPMELTKPNKDDYTEAEALMIDKMHKEKIKLSDAILVVNVNGYIGNSTNSEIEYAKSLNKEILYYTDIIKQREKDLVNDKVCNIGTKISELVFNQYNQFKQ